MDGNNERWAQYWVNRYSWALDGRSDVDADDLMQAARLGILRARRKYDGTTQNWATLSSYYIRKEILHALGKRNGALPPRLMSLDVPIAQDAEETLLDSLADESLPEMDEKLRMDELKSAVRQAVDRLENPRQRQCVRSVGLDGESLVETARRMGVTRQRAFQLVQAGCQRLWEDRRLRALADIELRTRYDAHQGVAAFLSTRTSVVEQAVLWRLEQMEKAGLAEQNRPVRVESSN